MLEPDVVDAGVLTALEIESLSKPLNESAYTPLPPTAAYALFTIGLEPTTAPAIAAKELVTDVSTARPVGRFVCTTPAKVADVGEKASSADRFEPGRVAVCA